MAILTLDRVWLNLVSTGEGITAYSSERSLNTKLDGEVRRYAGGRQRAITAPGKRREFPLVLRDVSDADVLVLDQWLGLLMVVRDHRGKVMFGTYLSTSRVERRTLNYNDVALTFIELTYVEGA